AYVHRMLHDYRVTVQLDVRNIGHEPHAELGRHARREIASERGRWKDRDAISASAHSLGDDRRDSFRIVLCECTMLGDNHLVRAVLRELRRAVLDTRRTGDERMYLPTGGVGYRSCRGHGLERYLAKLAVTGLRKCKYVCHDYRTFASVWSSLTSSGTAATPSPMMRPGARSGGSSICVTVTVCAPSCAGFTSSGFFFAAMIPLSAG